MQNFKRAFWGMLAVLALPWLIAEPTVFQSATFFALRGSMVQLSGIAAIGCMSVAMMLALRPRWPERWLGGLDKMYRLHKWLGIAALVFAIVHWLWSKGPKWAVGWGVLERPVRGPRPAIENSIEALFANLREPAEGLGEWAFYATVVLVALALIQYFPYRLFYKTHRLLAAGHRHEDDGLGDDEGQHQEVVLPSSRSNEKGATNQSRLFHVQLSEPCNPLRPTWHEESCPAPPPA